MINTKSFSTQSEIRAKDNIPHIDGLHIIGLDMGYSAPKCFHEKGNFIFSNYCRKITGDIFGELIRNDLIHENLDTGEKHCVGNMAMKSLSEDSVVAEDALFGRNHYLHPNFKVTFETALGIALWDTLTDGTDEPYAAPLFKGVEEPAGCVAKSMLIHIHFDTEKQDEAEALELLSTVRNGIRCGYIKALFRSSCAELPLEGFHNENRLPKKRILSAGISR